MLHDHFLDLDLGPIGRVVTSEDSPATAHEFFFWTAETEAAQNLDIGHIAAAAAGDGPAGARRAGPPPRRRARGPPSRRRPRRPPPLLRPPVLPRRLLCLRWRSRAGGPLR